MTADRPDPALGEVVVGGYVLEAGGSAGTTVKPGAAPAATEAEALAQALAEPEQSSAAEPSTAEAAGALVDEAAEATTQVERALALGKGLAEGEVLDPAQLGLEIGALLDLLERLDRRGRAKEALRLARALSTLYLLLRRWAALVPTLRVALHAAEELRDLRAIGWAKHELGTLQLAGGDAGAAEQSLGEALAIRRRVGDPAELAATEGNLRALSRRPPTAPAEARRGNLDGAGRSVRLLPALTVGALLFVVGVAGGAVVGGSGDDGGEANPAATATETETVTETAAGPAGETVTETVTEVETVTETVTVEVPSPEEGPG